MIEDLRWVADLGGLGVLALFIVVGGVLARVGMNLFKTSVLPLVQNHLEHLESSYEKLAASLDRYVNAIEGMERVQDAHAQALDAHNELTKRLIDRLP